MLPAPIADSGYSKEKPASLAPVLRWSKVEGAPVYEVEVFAGEKKIVSSSRIYTNGYNVLLPANFPENKITWQVRALNLDRVPLTPFSSRETVYVDKQLPPVQYPVPTNSFDTGNGTKLLYPVYNWIPVAGATKYEIEILDQQPENPQGTAPSSHRIGQGESTGFAWYDDDKRVSSAPMYWRVRGLNDKNEAVGIYSPAQKFTLDPKNAPKVGTLGDSITHGGGAVSYSPGDWEYDYQYYLKFPTVNLGESGDTSASMRARFAADVLPFNFTHLLIMGGSNSLRADVSAEEVIDDLEAMRQMCLEHNIMPIFLTLPAINPGNIKRAFDQDTSPDWQDKFARVNAYIKGERHIDLGAVLPTEGLLPTNLGIDGLHLDVPGKKLMAKAINEQWEAIISAKDE